MARQFDAEVLADLIGLIYEAAVDPARWPAFLDRYAGAMQAEGTGIWLQDLDTDEARFNAPDRSFVANVRFDPDWLASYVAHYAATNVWTANEQKLKEGTAYTSPMLCPERQLLRSEFYHDWLKPQGLRYGIGGAVVRRDNLAVLITSLRSKRASPYTDADLRLCRIVMTHLKRASGVHMRLAEVRGRGDGAMQALDLLSTGVWLVGPDGAVLFANKVAAELIGGHRGIWIDQSGRLRASNPGEDSRLQTEIRQAALTGQGRGLHAGGALRIARRDGSWLNIVVSPLPCESDTLTGNAAAAVFVSDPARTPCLPADILIRLYGLTPAEARLALALAGGSSPKQYSVSAGVSEQTARTHLKRVLAKTGTRRQAELVKRLI